MYAIGHVTIRTLITCGLTSSIYIDESAWLVPGLAPVGGLGGDLGFSSWVAALSLGFLKHLYNLRLALGTQQLCPLHPKPMQ